MTERDINTAIRALFDGVEAAWKNGDARTFGSYFADDAVYVGRTGAAFEGRAAIEQGHAEVFAGIFKDTTLHVITTRAQLLGDDLALVHARLITTAADAVTETQATATALLTCTPDGLRITAAHTTQLDQTGD